MRLLLTIIVTLLLSIAPPSYPALESSVPISAATGTSIARDLFPVTVKLDASNLYLTDPVLQFIDAKRIGLQLRLQAYDHRPEAGVAISEMGTAVVSGELGYDADKGEILLHNPRVDSLEFDRQNDVTRRLSKELMTAWSTHASNPIRSGLPPHPYLVPFRHNISELTYDGQLINLVIRL